MKKPYWKFSAEFGKWRGLTEPIHTSRNRSGFSKLPAFERSIVAVFIGSLLICPECWDPDQPQLMLGTFPVDDPQALRNPRKDTTYVTSGVNVNGNVSGGSRDIQWGWNPVGGARNFDAALTPNYLALNAQVGTVTIQIGS